MSSDNSAKSIDEVKRFWTTHPLFTGESSFEPGTKEFFDEHRSVYFQDCFAGKFDERFYPPPRKNGQTIEVLDLGCGIGFWTTELGMRGIANLTACDLTSTAVEITQKRIEAYGVKALVNEGNAEALQFETASFDHVNCQGVIHHTPNTEQAVSEIARILKPGGTASVSVYYRNILLRMWPIFRWLTLPLRLIGTGLHGRGREKILSLSDADEIVRMYDGDGNPIGKCYSRKQFIDLLEPYFEIADIYFHFFPARALPFRFGGRFHRWLDSHIPFMVYANVKKKCAQS